MRRSIHFALVLTIAAACAFLSACGLTADQRARIAANAIKDGDAAVLGFLTGGRAGAIAGLTAQEIANIKERQKTAAKNPPSTPITP